jgi:hypothetical protein
MFIQNLKSLQDPQSVTLQKTAFFPTPHLTPRIRVMELYLHILTGFHGIVQNCKI